MALSNCFGNAIHDAMRKHGYSTLMLIAKHEKCAGQNLWVKMYEGIHAKQRINLAQPDYKAHLTEVFGAPTYHVL